MTSPNAHAALPSRRTVLKAGVAAGTAIAVTAAGPAARAQDAGPAAFLHGVASGDPLADAVVLWTRITPSPQATPGSGVGGPVQVDWEVAADASFRSVVRRGSARTSAAQDHTVTVDVDGLEPYTRYWYRFRALGATSPVGRTQTTAGDGAVHALRLGLVSCSNFTGGYFSAYRHLAEREDLDVVLHLGDYVYEYGNGEDRYGPAELAGLRDHVPATEMVTLADYRQRHAQYKTDPDLQAAHAAVPWIVVFDDHEVANNTYDAGAENHQPETEGDFLVRRRGAYQAYLEWMPVRLPEQGVPHRGTRFWRSFSFGPLADLFVLDTRQNRSAEASSGNDVQALNDPARVLVEPEQMAALTEQLRSDRAPWHLVGNQVVFTRVQVQPGLPGQEQLSPLVGTPVFNTDQWDGYQDDQREVVAAMTAGASDTVVLTGDIHSSWANEIPVDPGTYRLTGDSAAVEFVTPSITSDGFQEILGGSAEAAAAATTGLQASNPNIKYLDGSGHGFAVLDVTPERVQTDFWHISERTDPDASIAFVSAWSSERGSKRVVAAPSPLGPRSDSPRVLTGGSSSARRPSSAPPVAVVAAPRSLPATGGSATGAGAALLAAAVLARRLRRDAPGA